MVSPIKLQPNLQQISTHCRPITNKIFNFLTGNNIPLNQVMGHLRDLGRCRQVNRTWREIGESQQTDLLEQVRASAFPSIPQGPNLIARCTQFFQTIMQNMQNGVCAGRFEVNQLIGNVKPSVHRGNLFTKVQAVEFGRNQDVMEIYMGSLADHQIRRTFRAAAQETARLNVQDIAHFRVSEDGKLVAHKRDDDNRELLTWDNAIEDLRPVRTVQTPSYFTRFCLIKERAACVGTREIFFLDLNSGAESGARIEIPDELEPFGVIEATTTKLYFARENAVDVFDHIQRRYERRIALPEGVTNPIPIPFNDRLFLLAQDRLYAVDPMNFSINLITQNVEVDAAPLGIVRPQELLDRRTPEYYTHRQFNRQNFSESWFRQDYAVLLDKIAVTTHPHTRIYDLRTQRHLTTLKHDNFDNFSYTALFDGKLHVAGCINRYVAGLGPAHTNEFEVEIYDFNPPEGAPLLEVQEQNCFYQFMHYVGDFFTRLWVSLRNCLGI